MIDTFGVPEFFCDAVGEVEDLGFGLVRVVRGVKRGGQFIPVVSIVLPAVSVAETGQMIRTVCTLSLKRAVGMSEASH